MFDELIPSFVIGSANFGNPAFESAKKRQKPGVGKVSVMEMLLQNPVTATFLPCTLQLSIPPFQVKKNHLFAEHKGQGVYVQSCCLGREWCRLCLVRPHLSWSVLRVLWGKPGKWLAVRAGKEKSHLRLTWCYLMFCFFEKRRFCMERTSSGLPHSSCDILILRVNDSFVKRGYFYSMGKDFHCSPMSASIDLVPGWELLLPTSETGLGGGCCLLPSTSCGEPVLLVWLLEFSFLQGVALR